MDKENTLSTGFGGKDSEKSQSRKSRKKKSDTTLGLPTPLEVKEESTPTPESNLIVIPQTGFLDVSETKVEPPAPSAPTPPSPVVAQGRTKPHRIFPSRYRR